MADQVRDFYNRNAQAEWNRFAEGMSRIEFASTLRLVRNHFPPKGRVCDVGAGPGRYSIELARMGYRVTVFDLAEENLRLARLYLRQAQLEAEAYVRGTATDLAGFPSGSFDAALALGPLYHLLSGRDRLSSLRELRRVLRPGGVAIIAYLNSWGLMRTGLIDFPLRFATAAGLRAMLESRALDNVTSGFTDCYWSTPPEALSEVKEAGLTVITYAGVEGFAGGMHSVIDRLASEAPAVLEAIVGVAPETSELPQYRDATDHVHIVVSRGE